MRPSARWRPIVAAPLALLLLAPLSPVAGGAGSTCGAPTDRTAVPLVDELYARHTQRGGQALELWHESNRVPGLQASSWRCGDGTGGEADAEWLRIPISTRVVLPF